MKANKIIKTMLIIILVLGISMVSFIGIYIKDKNTTINLVKDYTLGDDLVGVRRIVLKVDDSVITRKYDKEGKEIEESDTTTEVANTESISVNPEAIKTTQNYEKSRKIIEDRLKDLKVEDYTIRQELQNGTIIIELPENNNTDSIISKIYAQGKLELIDTDTNIVLLNNDMLEKATAGVGEITSGYVAFLDIQFNKEGTSKFKDISNSYKETTNEAGEKVKKTVTLKMDNVTVMTTSFSTEITNGILQLTMGNPSTSQTDSALQNYYQQAKTQEIMLNKGKMPVAYSVEQNKYVKTDISKETLNIVAYVAIAIVVILMVYLSVRYKKIGMLNAITFVGYIATLLLVIRYTNVILSISGLVGIGISIVIYYLMTLAILRESKQVENAKRAFTNAMKNSMLRMVPVIIIAVIFTFASNFSGGLPIFSLGMTMFWGIIVGILYHYGITKTIMIASKKEEE